MAQIASSQEAVSRPRARGVSITNPKRQRGYSLTPRVSVQGELFRAGAGFLLAMAAAPGIIGAEKQPSSKVAFTRRGTIMLRSSRLALAVFVGAALLAGSLQAADKNNGLTKGTPDLKSAGALAFGPDGILFVGDSRGGAVFAIDA